MSKPETPQEAQAALEEAVRKLDQLHSDLKDLELLTRELHARKLHELRRPPSAGA